MKKNFEILSNADSLLVAYKYPFVYTVLTGDGTYPSLEKSLYHELKKNYLLVYPLELMSSGIVLLAENQKALTLWSNRLSHNELEFTYELIVKAPLFFEEKASLKKNIALEKKTFQFHENGEEFEVHFEIVKIYKHYAHIKAICKKPLTMGVLLFSSYLGSPVVGDKIYGLKENLYLSFLKGRKFKPKGEEKEEQPLLKRPALHLSQVVFKNDVWTAPYPKDFKSLTQKLDKYDRFVEEDVFLQDILDTLKD